MPDQDEWDGGSDADDGFSGSGAFKGSHKQQRITKGDELHRREVVSDGGGVRRTSIDKLTPLVANVVSTINNNNISAV